MAHNIRIRGFGFWINGGPIDETEFEAFDQTLFEAVNGDLGGTWAPSTPIVIGGAGFQVTSATANFATITVDGDATLSGSVQLGTGISDGINCLGTAEFFSPVLFDDAVSFDSTVDYNAAVSFHGVVVVGDSGADLMTVLSSTDFQAATTTFTNAITVGGTATFNGNIVLGNAASDTVTLNAVVTNTGGGHTRERYAIGANANGTYDIATADVVYIATGTLSAARDYTIADGTNGDRMRIFTKDSGFAITVKRADTTVIAILQDASGQIDWIDIMVISNVWTLIGFYRIP